MWEAWAITGAVIAAVTIVAMTWGVYVGAHTHEERERWKGFAWVLLTIAAGCFIASAFLAPWSST